MTALAESRQVDHNISKALEAALARGALPGESEGFDQKAMLTAAAFIAGTAATRRPGHVAIAMETLGEGATGRYMRIAIVNDDMPFLVDSIANALAAAHILIHRLLHPLLAVDPETGNASLRESVCQ